MPDPSRTLKIKDFGKDKSFESVMELKKVLSSEYQNRKVSIVFTTRPHGMLQVIYVSVESNGTIRETYGDQAEVDFSKISVSLM